MRYFFALQNGNTSPTLIKDLILDRKLEKETAEEASQYYRPSLVKKMNTLSTRLKKKYSKKWREMRVDHVGEKASGTLTCSVSLEGIGLSLVGRENREVLYGVIQGIHTEVQILQNKSVFADLTVCARRGMNDRLRVCKSTTRRWIRGMPSSQGRRFTRRSTKATRGRTTWRSRSRRRRTRRWRSSRRSSLSRV